VTDVQPTVLAATAAARRQARQGIHVPSFVWTLIRTDFKIRYHGSLGGLLWALLRPLALFLVLQAIFSLVFTMDGQYRLNLIIGLFLWDFFVEASRAGLGSLAAKGHLLTKIRLPRWLVVVTSTSNAVITLLIFVVIILGATVAAGRPPSLLHGALFIGYLVLFWVLIVGFALASSVVFLRYRDLNQFWDLILQVGFFAAPIVYPLGILPERIHFFLYCWPPTPVIQFSRSVLVEGELPTARAHVLLLGVTVVTLIAGALIFRRLSRRAPEYV
jgi:lipopolysaccharide transport system permease protein